MSAETSGAYERVKARLKVRLMDLLDGASGPSRARAPQRQALEEDLRQAFKALSEEHRVPHLSNGEEHQLIQEIMDEVIGLGPLEALLADPAINEIMVNGPRQIFIEQDGKILPAPESVQFKDTAHLLSVIERLLGAAGISVSEAEPCIDASLPDGSRVNVVIPPIALNGPTLTIRKQVRQFAMEDWVGFGSISPTAAQFLEACVNAKVNIVVAGGTSSGKTTLVSILARNLKPDERVITIENVAELELPCPHWVRLVARPGNAEGRGEVSLRALVKNALRMRPDRLILGEARGGEALDVIQAMVTGHEGVITVLHANSPQSALERLETLMLMSGIELPAQSCRQQIASAVELVIYLSHFPDGSRRVEKIVQVVGTGADGFRVEELFAFQVERTAEEGTIIGTLKPTGVQPRFRQKFLSHNIHLPEDLLSHA